MLRSLQMRGSSLERSPSSESMKSISCSRASGIRHAARKAFTASATGLSMGRMDVPLGRFCAGGSYLPTYHWLLTGSCTRFLLGWGEVRSGVRTSGVPVSGPVFIMLGGIFTGRVCC